MAQSMHCPNTASRSLAELKVRSRMSCAPIWRGIWFRVMVSCVHITTTVKVTPAVITDVAATKVDMATMVVEAVPAPIEHFPRLYENSNTQKAIPQ